jgi:hypothetical protein
MSIHFDEKGKFFTEVVPKEPVPVRIQTLTHRIQGNIHIRPGERLKDELNQAVQFVAVTDAVVYGSSGDEICRTEFMIVNIDQIVWLTPEQDSPQSQDQGGATK